MNTISAYTEGYYAYQDGRSNSENPYEYATNNYIAWEAGHRDAYDSEEYGEVNEDD